MTTALMYRDWLADPHDPSRTGTAAYGHNHAGAFPQLAVWALVELVVLYAVLAPGSARAGVGRAAVALGLVLPWALMSLMLTMHAGGIMVLHALWVVALSAGTLVVLLSRIVARRRA
ncbi:MAG TPA: hypothetical protein VIK91_00310 [Nannocystis sp.]